MTTIVGSAAGGIWTATGSWVGGVVPTAADDVQLDATSGNITTTGAGTCVARSLDCTGYTGTLSGGAALALGDATAGAGNIALKLVAGMTFTFAPSISFVSTSGTQQTIDMAGKSVGGNLLFSGAGGNWKALSALTIGNQLNISAGTLDLNNNNVSGATFNSAGAVTRSLTLGTATITLTSTWVISGSGLTLSAASSTITSATSTFTGGGMTYGTVNLTGGAVTLSGANTFGTLTRTGSASTAAALTLSADQIVTGAFTATGNSAINRLLINSSVGGTPRTITAGSVSLSNVDFADIVAAGAAVPWTGTSMGDALGNTGITCDAPTTQTHTASAGGNWSDVTKWTSRIPLPQDTVVVDVNTTGTLTVDMRRLGADVTFAGFAGTVSFGVAATMYGSLVWGAGTTISGANALTLAGRSSKTVTSNGRTYLNAFTIDAPGGTYTLVDALSTLSLKVNSGTLTTAGFTVAISGQYVQIGGTLDLGASVVNMSSAGGITAWSVTGGTVNAGTSQIVFVTTATSFRQFAGGGQTYNTLTYTVAGSTGSLNITGANTFGTINFSDATNARTLNLPASTTTTVGTFNVNGTSGKLMSIISSTAGTQTTLAKSGGGIVSCDYLSVKDIAATPSGDWFAGANSTNVSNNTGWVFNVGVAGTDTGTLADVDSALVATGTDNDAVTLVDADSVGAIGSDSDTGSLVDNAGAISLVDADTGGFTDTDTDTSPTAASSDGDTGALADADLVAVSVSDADTGGFTENNLTVVVLSDADTGTFTEVDVIATDVSDADTGAFAETDLMGAAGSDTDTGSLIDADTTTAVLADGDTGSLVDAEALVAALVDAETLTVAEGDEGPTQVVDFETFTLTDADLMGAVLSDGDTAGLVDDAALAALLDGAEVGSFAESTALVRPWLFRPPSVEEGGQLGSGRLFGRYRLTQGVTVAVAGDDVFEMTHPYQGDLEEYDRVYRGGYVHVIDDDEAALLVAAGYGPNIT